jgi:hypothetical protein
MPEGRVADTPAPGTVHHRGADGARLEEIDNGRKGIHLDDLK